MTVSPTLKQEASVSEQAPPATDSISRVGPGSHLKTAREARRMSIEEVANRLRLKKNVIMDIEADIYDPGLAFTFIKGYLRAYARLVHVSPDVVLKAFDQLNIKEHKTEFVLPKMPVTTWQGKENYVRWAVYGVTALLALAVIGFSAWWLIQPRSPEPVSQDLVKLLNNVDDKQRSTKSNTLKPSEGSVENPENAAEAQTEANAAENAEPAMSPVESAGGSMSSSTENSLPKNTIDNLGVRSNPSMLLPNTRPGFSHEE